MNLFKLVGSIFIDNDEANKSISKTDSQAESLAQKFVKGASTAVKWGAAIGAGAIAGATALTAMASKSAAASDNIDKMSQKIGISRQTYQELDFICSQCGASVDNLKAGMKTLTNQMQMAEEGSSTATAAFEALGLSWTDGTGKLKDQETMMWEALTALQACENQTEKAALATDLFGKAGTELMPMLNGSANSIEEMKQKAHELGLVLDDETIDAGVVFTDTMDQVKRSLSTIVTKVGAEVMPVVQSGLDFIIEHMPEIQSAIETAFDAAGNAISFVVDGFKSMATWVDENQGKLKALAVTVGILTTAIIAYNTAQAIKNAGGIAELAQLALLQVQIWGLTAAETAHTVATTIATGATTAFGAAVNFLTSPVTLAVVAIGALIAIGVLLYKNWDTVKEKATELWNNLTEKFEKIKNSVTEKIESTKKAVTEKFENMKNSASEKIESMKQSASEKFDSIKNKIDTTMQAARDTVKEKLQNMKDAYDEHGGGIKGIAYAAMEGVKGYYSAGYTFIDNLTGGKLSSVVSQFKSKMSDAKEAVSNRISNIKSSFSNGLSSAYNTVSSKFNSIKSKISSIMDSAREKVSSAISKIKSAFNFSWSLPKIKLPHFKVSGGKAPWGFMGQGSLPRISVSWYKKAMEDGMIMNKPTIFGYDAATNSLMGGGEAGSETVVGTQSLMEMIASAVSTMNNESLKVLMEILVEIRALNGGLYDTIVRALQTMGIEFDERELGRLVRKYA